MRVLLTFGPSWEPLDGARRLTNLSTGRLGTELAEAFADAGWEVHALRGEGSTHPAPRRVHALESFSTNDDLAARLRRLAGSGDFDAVFHAAALCDYRIAAVRDASGRDLRSPKIATRDGRIILELEPASKVLPQLRGWFPDAWIAGWKFELAGSRDDAFGKARRQLADCGTDACVLNGAAHGPGYTLCLADGETESLADSSALAHALVARLVPATFSHH